jgi:glucoamylase
MVTSPAPAGAGEGELVFLFDVDNTLLDNDRVQADLQGELARRFGAAAHDRYWAILEALRGELGYVDYLGALERYRLEHLHDPRVLGLSCWLVDYQFADRLYPGALQVRRHAQEHARAVILSDGDAVFQPRKVERAGRCSLSAPDGSALPEKGAVMSMHAFGHPGIAPTWTSSAKDMVGCALGPARLWFTSGYGILNEVFCPRVDIPQIRDLGFIVADGNGFWVEVKRLGSYRTEQPQPGIPALEIVHRHARFELHLRIAPDRQREVLLIEVRLHGDGGLRPYALLAPRLGGTGEGNHAAVGRHLGRTVLWAEQGPFGLALAAANPDQTPAWRVASAGYVGASDGWQDFTRNGALTWQFDEAGPGNVALIGELPAQATLALGFGTSRESAATLAFAALAQPFAEVWQRHVNDWRAWHDGLRLPETLPEAVRSELTTSAMVLRVHQDKTYPGAMVASLSVPWGNSRNDIGGYHLVWPRDLVESAGGLLALGAIEETRDILRYFIATQHGEGNWSQNQWLGGKAFWHGEQLDETAFPVLLAAALDERGALDTIEIRPMTRRALAFIARHGPATQQDRWEEDAGLSAFTLGTCIAALVCGARFLEEPARQFALRLADFWNARIEDWTSAHGTKLASKHGVQGYYVRIAPPPASSGTRALDQILPIKNLACDPGIPADEQVGTDFLQLVRLGLRDAHDPLVADSVAIVDRLLKVDTPSGPAWHRYTGDGYGEAPDGSPFDGTGRGRAWPLLTGERGHYELAAGRDPLPYLRAMSAMAGRCGLIPEQIWDADPIPERFLYPGKPTGSAMPLVWAHAEFIKLAMSCSLGRPGDRPQAVWERYRGKRPQPTHAMWAPRFPVAEIHAGQTLCVCLPAPARVHFGIDGWKRIADVTASDSGLGLYAAELPTAPLQPGERVQFTCYWTGPSAWEGRDYEVEIR